MYRITLNGECVYDSSMAVMNVPGLVLINPTITQELNKAGELSFSLPPNHTSYKDFIPLNSVLHVWCNESMIFKARLISDNTDTMKTKKLICEGAMAFLNDSRIRPFDFAGRLEEFIAFIVSEHNTQVKTYQRFSIGSITVSDDYVHYSSTKYLSAWEVIRTRLIDTHGGYVRVRYGSDGKSILDYVSDFANADTHDIQLGENLTKLVRGRSTLNTYTAIIPLGAKIETVNANGETEESRLTIESVNNGSDYLINSRLAALYGVIYAPTSDTTWENVTLAENLLERGTKYLNNIASNIEDTIEIEAVKLHEMSTGAGRDKTIKFGDKVRIRSAPHGVDVTMLIGKMITRLDKPLEARLTLGYMRKSMLSSAIALGDRIEQIEGRYITRGDVVSVISRELVSHRNPTLTQGIKAVVDQYMLENPIEEEDPTVGSLSITELADIFK